MCVGDKKARENEAGGMGYNGNMETMCTQDQEVRVNSYCSHGFVRM